MKKVFGPCFWRQKQGSIFVPLLLSGHHNGFGIVFAKGSKTLLYNSQNQLFSSVPIFHSGLAAIGFSSFIYRGRASATNRDEKKSLLGVDQGQVRIEGPQGPLSRLPKGLQVAGFTSLLLAGFLAQVLVSKTHGRLFFFTAAPSGDARRLALFDWILTQTCFANRFFARGVDALRGVKFR